MDVWKVKGIVAFRRKGLMLFLNLYFKKEIPDISHVRKTMAHLYDLEKCRNVNQMKKWKKYKSGYCFTRSSHSHMNDSVYLFEHI